MRGYVKRVTQKAEKLSKEQLLSLIQNLAEENDSLYSILESLSTGLLIVDNDFKLVQSNTIAESRVQFSIYLDDPKVSTAPIWEFIDDEEIAGFLQNCAEKEITNSAEDFSTVTSGGSVRFLNVTITPLVIESNLAGRIILIRDITENKNQDILMHRMENMANLTNLAAGMAHDIKNPLGAISIHIQLIQKALKKARENENILPEKKFVEDHIDVVNAEIEHLNKLVMDFLLAVRPVKANLELKDPSKIIENIVNFFKPEFQSANVDVDFKPCTDTKRIMLDEKLFREAIINIAQNALAAIKTRQNNESSTYKGSFIINCSIKDEKYKIRIADNGCGMSDEVLSKIFEPYYTTKSNGTGLGMTMVYKIIKELSGEITVDSKEYFGTIFTITLPIPQKNTKLIMNEE